MYNMYTKRTKAKNTSNAVNILATKESRYVLKSSEVYLVSGLTNDDIRKTDFIIDSLKSNIVCNNFSKCCPNCTGDSLFD